MVELIHADLTYRVRGVLMDVHNKLKPLLPERFYENALAIGLETRGISYETQKAFEVFYRQVRVGLYIVDVWIEGGKVILELKVAPCITPLHKAQAISYLKVTDADLALVANFGAASLEVERLPNFIRDRQSSFHWQPLDNAEGLLYPELTNQVFRSLHRVHSFLGPGFLSQVYRRAMMVELERCDIGYRYIKQLPVTYEGHILGYHDTRLILVDDRLVVAAFALSSLSDPLREQFKTYLRHLEMKLGFLANFYGTTPEVEPVRVG
jgi:GxxExxY protein